MAIVSVGVRSLRRCRSLAWLAASVALVVLPGCGSGQKPPLPVEQVVISDVYSKLASYAQKHDVEFDLADFSTRAVADLASPHWVDLVTMPGAESIDTVVARRLDDRGKAYATFVTTWNPDVPAWAEGDEATQLSTVSVPDALSQAG